MVTYLADAYVSVALFHVNHSLYDFLVCAAKTFSLKTSKFNPDFPRFLKHALRCTLIHTQAEWLTTLQWDIIYLNM